MVKQTVLSSITAKELNIDVGSNTDLKGSLIAAGYYDENGNFIDNGKLRLKTDTLSFSNLSNTRYDKSNSLSIGTNYAFKDPQQGSGSKDGGSQDQSSQAKSGTSLQDKKNATDPKSKISSINYSNNRNLSYSMSKSLATIGKGELIVGDKDISSLSKDELASLQSDPNNKALYNSDDLTRLNRDSSKLNKELYSTKLNSNVDASVDMRLFSEGGRKEIKDELNRGSAIDEAINLIATTENAKVSKIFDYIGGFTSGYDKDSMSLAANLDVLDDPGADIFKKQRAAQDIANQMGVKVKFANLNRGSGGKFNSDDPNAVYINTKHISNAKEFMASLRHELVHRSDNKRGTFIPKDPAQNQFATNYALGMLSMSEKALRLNGRSLNDYSPRVNPNDKTVVADTRYFYSLDQRKSDDVINYMLRDEDGSWVSIAQAQGELVEFVSRGRTLFIIAHGGAVTSDGSKNIIGSRSPVISKTADEVYGDIINDKTWQSGNVEEIYLGVCYSARPITSSGKSFAEELHDVIKTNTGKSVKVKGFKGSYYYRPYGNGPENRDDTVVIGDKEK